MKDSHELYKELIQLIENKEPTKYIYDVYFDFLPEPFIGFGFDVINSWTMYIVNVLTPCSIGNNYVIISSGHKKIEFKDYIAYILKMDTEEKLCNYLTKCIFSVL